MPTREFWRVNSYSYPNPFSSAPKALQAWITLASFRQVSSYSELKAYWASGSGGRRLDAHTVESWKATFEEFGLLYVMSRSDNIVITPAGRQFFEAADKGNSDDLVWIGLNLLLRYPLAGPPRRSRGERYDESDLLLYWFLYGAMRELSNELWWPELERVLCYVFTTAEARTAVQSVAQLRAGARELSDFPEPPVARGAFYNSLNQVIVHAGMHHVLFEGSNSEAFYSTAGGERHHWIAHDRLRLIDLALGGSAQAVDCADSASYVARMPTAPDFIDHEESYFAYVGAAVKPLAEAALTTVETVPFEGGLVPLLRAGIHYQVSSSTTIEGPITALCRLSGGQRLILSHDHARSYIIDGKELVPGNKVRISVRRARPIVNAGPILDLLGGSNG